MTPSDSAQTLATAGAWDSLLQNPSASARRQFHQWYGDEVPWRQLRKVLQAFMRRYGADRMVSILRSPGRINLLAGTLIIRAAPST